MDEWKKEVKTLVNESKCGSNDSYRLGLAIGLILDHLPDEDEMKSNIEHIEVKDIVRWEDGDCVVQGKVLSIVDNKCNIQSYLDCNYYNSRSLSECTLVKKGNM